MLKAIIFDLDGTVLNTSKDLAMAVNRTRTYFHLEPLSVQRVLECVGNGFVVLMEKAIPEIDANEALVIFKQQYAECYMDETVPYKGVSDLLKALNTKAIKIAVNTNKDDGYSKNLIRKNFPDIEFIDVVGTVPERKKKPDPAGVDFILNKMGLQKEEAAYVGDSDVDIKTAINAGLMSISCTWGFRSKEELKNAGAINLIDTPEELLNYIV